ncbi:putative signal peptidase complex subunit 1 [Cinnamomum micranthum f. kanehirae]|uniref:Signal peptidase complex subunit 1 n=1 Tax=Cinnamomum micranthum f. kanehirae TaxID=337451 RepID=A0A3S3N9C8_9MAGN|nr:putative signal peptidase complex subunit 1 [Cinnamomum micranthum f. kanehirae]
MTEKSVEEAAANQNVEGNIPEIMSSDAPSKPIKEVKQSSMMDWQGQKLAELLMQIVLGVFAVVAFVVGYSVGSFQTMLLIYAGGVVLTTLLIVPKWPFLNRHPLNWLDPIEAERHPKPQPLTSKKKSSSKHK